MLRSPSRRCEPTDTSSERLREFLLSVPGDDALTVLQDQREELRQLALTISTDQVDIVHPPYLWTIRQVLSHLAEGERVFGYRILRIAAGDATALPGWDENAYADSRYGLGNFDHLVEEIDLLRQANLRLLRRLRPTCWDRCGTVDAQQMTVRALAWLAAAHLQHHLAIVTRRIAATSTIDD